MRSNWKSKNIGELIKNKNDDLTLGRSLIVDYSLLDSEIYVYNGKVYKKFIVTNNHLFHKGGEFVITRNLMNKEKKEKKMKKKMLKGLKKKGSKNKKTGKK